MNTVAMNILVTIFLWLCFLLNKYIEVEFLTHLVKLFVCLNLVFHFAICFLCVHPLCGPFSPPLLPSLS